MQQVAVNESNYKMAVAFSVTQDAMKELIDNGIEVTGVIVQSGTGFIRVQYSPACDDLRVFAKNSHADETKCRALLKGTVIEWTKTHSQEEQAA